MGSKQLLALAAEENPQELSYREGVPSTRPSSEEEKRLYERVIAEQ